MATDWDPSLWLDKFNEMVDEELDYGDQWTLNFNYNQTAQITAEDKRRGWKIYSHCAFAKFLCGSCSKTWPSARVVVLFRYRLRDGAGRGTVIMRPFGQACRRCQGETFYLPGFAEDVAENALLRMFSKILKNCYGEDDQGDGGAPCTDNVKTKPHEKSLCEACQLGICCQED